MIRKIVSLLIVLLAAFLCWWLMRTAPVQTTEEKPRSAKIVKTISPLVKNHPISVSAYGSVIPARSLTIRPEITGRIISQHPALVPGGRITAGETLFTIDDADYQIALREARTALEEARSEIDLEAGRQIIAQRELEQLRKDLPESAINEDLVLRKPFKESTEARLERAAAAVTKAELDLSRTSVKAPFNAVVIEESVETGLLADSSSALVTFVGTDAFWVQASVPLCELKWIKLPTADQPGANAKVLVSTNDGPPLEWSGKVVRLLSDLEAEGRQARVLIEVPKPLDSNPAQPLLLGTYLRVEIDSGTLPDALEIPRTGLREGNRVWLVGPEKTLLIRDVEILWSREESVIISNTIAEGETLIISDLRAPLPGMALSPEPVQPSPEK
jgi:RND family efflux transporter MFP subunit